MDAEEDTQEEVQAIYKIGNKTLHPMKVRVHIEGRPLLMEIDTGAAVSLISETVWKKEFPQVRPIQTNVVLQTYTGEPIPMVGKIIVHVSYGNQSDHFSLYVVKGDGPSLLGREWLRKLTLDWKTIGMAAQAPAAVDSLLQTYSEIFEDGLGTLKQFEARLHVKPGAQPKFHKARSVPFALKEAIGAELDRLEREGVLKKVDYAEWAAPVVAVPKGDGQIRLCEDYKVTINPVLDVDKYPLPKKEDLLASLAGGQKFSKIDLTQAYQQMTLGDEAKIFVT